MIMYRLDFSTCTSFTTTWFFYTDTLISFVYINNCFSKILINMFRFSFSFQHYLYVFFVLFAFQETIDLVVKTLILDYTTM